jgi:uncharacterized membrane protein
MPPVRVSDPPRLRGWRLGSLVALCAVVALLVAMATPSQADARRERCAAASRASDGDHAGCPAPPRARQRVAPTR